MAEEWSKYATILEMEDRRFRRAMQEEVSTSSSFEFSSKYRILARVDIITQYEIDLSIFKQCLALKS